MQVTTLADGQTIEFPDNIPEEQIVAELNRITGERRQAESMQQMTPMARGAMQVFGDIAGMRQQSQEELQYPTVPGHSFGMNFDQMMQVTDRINNTNQANASERIRLRAQRESAMEAEKDRAQQLKLEQQRQKNEMQMQKMRDTAQMELEKQKQGGRQDENSQLFRQSLEQQRQEYGLRGDLYERQSDADLARGLAIMERENQINRELRTLEQKYYMNRLDAEGSQRMEQLRAELDSLWARQTRELDSSGNSLADAERKQRLRQSVISELYQRYLNDPNYVTITADSQTGQSVPNFTPQFWQLVDQELNRRTGGTTHLDTGGGSGLRQDSNGNWTWGMP